MKNLIRISFLSIVLLSLSAFNAADEQLLPTKLRITVIDELGNFVEGATVSIYETEEDYRANKNAVGTDTSDSSGKVQFKGLKTISYYVDAQKEDLNNNAAGVKTAALEEGKLNKINTVIE